MQDKEFLAAAEKSQLEITPVPGDRIQALVKEAYDSAPALVAKAAQLLAVDKLK
jgi:hypothetical protein